MLDGCDRFAYQDGDDAKQIMRVQLRTDSGKAEMMRAYAHGPTSSFFMLTRSVQIVRRKSVVG